MTVASGLSSAGHVSVHSPWLSAAPPVNWLQLQMLQPGRQGPPDQGALLYQAVPSRQAGLLQGHLDLDVCLVVAGSDST